MTQLGDKILIPTHVAKGFFLRIYSMALTTILLSTLNIFIMDEQLFYSSYVYA